jgi:hypothetical protein
VERIACGPVWDASVVLTVASPQKTTPKAIPLHKILGMAIAFRSMSILFIDEVIGIVRIGQDHPIAMKMHPPARML